MKPPAPSTRWHGTRDNTHTVHAEIERGCRVREIDGNSTPVGTSDRHEYRLSLRSPRLLAYYVTLLVFGVILALIVSRFLSNDGGRAALIAFSISLFMNHRAQRLVVTPEGIEYSGASFQPVIPWEEVKFAGREGNAITSWFFGDRLLLPATGWGYRKPSVALEWFDPHWREGPIGDDIRRDAPWLIGGKP